MIRNIIEFSTRKPKWVIGITIALMLVALAQFPKIKIDTDPENMLSEKEFVRIFHNEVKREFGLYDYVVLGVVNEDDPEGVFNPSTLEKVYAISDKIKGIDGVIAYELMSPATKDDIEQDGVGAVRFKWLMGPPPYTAAAALNIKERAMANPMFYGTIVSENGKALCIYIPIKAKNISYRVSNEIRDIVAGLGGTEKYHITGLPVAQDTFGFEMFRQMAVSAPLSMAIIFFLMLGFFRHPKLVIAPLILAGVTVFMTMGLLIGLGFTVHIMSSMIPIFLMPIAVLDSVHILSEFFDRYQGFKDQKKAVMATIDDLFMPMLFTSLTTAAGFTSLAFAPIPPVQVFGVFVAIGVVIAWALTMTFIPAMITVMKKDSLENFGAKEEHADRGAMNRLLTATGRFSVSRWKVVLTGALAVICLSVYGITRIVINDNPMKWFSPKHELRIADNILNEHFGGTYTAYLVLEDERGTDGTFKEPEMLRYVEGLQRYAIEQGRVGKTTSLADVTKKVYYELLGGDRANDVIPPTRQAVAQCLMSFQNSHKPDDLWHFTDPAYSKINIWFQLKSGDNMDMSRVKKEIDMYLKDNPPPVPVKASWAGLTYINVVWQNRMVVGMLRNFGGSFIIVLFMMVFLFRSPVRGLISMIPLTVTIVFIYSLLGYSGKHYDMPVAVLSALTLGLSVDFAIHFLQRARSIYAEKGDWPLTVREMFGEPGRAILRNALIVSIGFLPLLAAPLVPYKTVGFFMFMIMLTSSVGTLLLLPAIITPVQGLVFAEPGKGMTCKCAYCALTGLIVAGSIAFVLSGYGKFSWTTITWVAVGCTAIMAGLCNLLSRRRICIQGIEDKEQGGQ